PPPFCTPPPLPQRPLHSFPTRRSSDLQPQQSLYLVEAVHELPLVEQYLAVRVVDDGLLDDGRADDVVHLRVTTIASPKYFLTVLDRKSTRLNSSHVSISYAVFCLKQKK